MNHLVGLDEMLEHKDLIHKALADFESKIDITQYDSFSPNIEKTINDVVCDVATNKEENDVLQGFFDTYIGLYFTYGMPIVLQLLDILGR